MIVLKRILFIVFGIFIVLLMGWAFVEFYPFIFSKRVVGKIERVERVDLNVSLMQTTGQAGGISSDMYAFAVAIKTDSGDIFTASAQDKQWAVVQIGQCAEARFYPYPFWDLNKSGTYYNARLLSLRECP